MIVSIVAGIILLIGTIVLAVLSRFTKTIPVAPRSKKGLDPYSQAVLRFRRMFQRRPFTASPTASTADSSEHGPSKNSSRSRTANFHSNIEIEAQKHRQSRILESHSMGMDLTVETNIFYTMTNLPNHIVATSNHLEYCFNDTSALSQTLQFYQQQLVNQTKAEEKWKKELQLAYLPPIAEVRSVESGSPAITPRQRYLDDLSASSSYGHMRFPPHDVPPRRQIPRAIFLFSGPEDRDLWLFPEDDEDEEDEADYSSDESDEKSPDVENQTLGTINVRQSTDSDIDVMYLSDLSSSGERNGSRRSWSPTSKRRRTNRSPRQSRMNSFVSVSGTQLSPIDEHNADEMETSRQQHQQQRLSQWMQLLRQPPILAWSSLSPKHHSPKTDNKTEHSDLQQQLQDGETISPSLPDTEGATARTVMMTQEALPPIPGSLYPRQLHPISLEIHRSGTDS